MGSYEIGTKKPTRVDAELQSTQFHNNPTRDDAESQKSIPQQPKQRWCKIPNPTQPNPKPTKTKWNKSKRQKETNPQGAKKQKEEK